MFNLRVKLKQKKLIKGKTYQKNEGHIRKKKQHKLLLNDEIENQ
jgi:hypothetical protein